MKLALVIEKYDPQGGGAERSTRQIAMELVSRGHDVMVICAQSEIDSDGEIKIHRLPNTGKLHATRLKRFSAWAKTQLLQGDFDVSVSMTTTVAATVLQPRSGTAKETMLRNLAIHASSNRLIKQILNRISPKKRALLSLEQQTLADPMLKRIAANSDYVKTQLATHYQVPSEKVVVVPNAATLPAFTVEQRANWRRTIRAGYQIPHDTDESADDSKLAVTDDSEFPVTADSKLSGGVGCVYFCCDESSA
ncbi:MAG: glycosyltransferase [Phycisphaeraceae bacterium]|nr:glycosyltransferase [Phycisphaeraceae bacterium]